MPAPGIPRIGLLAYNGFTFPAQFQATVEIKPIYDRSGRSVKYRRYELTVETILNGMDLPAGVVDVPIDTDMTTIRRLLTQPRQRLDFTDQGLGQIIVTSANDCDYGPKPQVVVWEPVGSNLSCRLVWKVSFVLTDCISASFGPFGDFSYDIRWRISRHGMQVRVITGYAEVKVTPVGRTIDTTAESSWLAILASFPRLLAFHRETDRQLSNDRKSMSFSITDEQIASDNPLFPGTVEMDIKHRVSNVSGAALSTFTSTISGTIKYAVGLSPIVAWQAFISVVDSRLGAIAFAVKPDGNPGAIIAVKNVDIEESIYDRSVRFSVSYRLSADWRSFINGSGLFRPVPGNWNAWEASITTLAQAARGEAGLTYSPSNDRLVDYCYGGAPTATSPRPTLTAQPIYENQLFSTACPDEANSFLDWHNTVRIERQTETVLVKRHTGSNDALLVGSFAMGLTPGGSGTGALLGTLSPAISTARPAQQLRSDSDYRLVMEGCSQRVGYAIDIPYLVSVNGSAPALASESIVPSALWKYSGSCPIYAAKWRRVYYVNDGETKNYVFGNVPAGYVTQSL